MHEQFIHSNYIEKWTCIEWRDKREAKAKNKEIGLSRVHLQSLTYQRTTRASSRPIQEVNMGDQLPNPNQHEQDPNKNNNNNNNDPSIVRRMREYTLPHVVEHPLCIVLPPWPHHFEIILVTVRILPNYYGMSNQIPYATSWNLSKLV